MKKLLCLLLILILFVSCAKKPENLGEIYQSNPPTITGTPSEVFNKTQFDFGVEILKRNFESENILISPLSIKLALAMVLNGADNETKKQMETAFSMTCEEINTELYKYVSSLSSNEIHIANSIWMQKDNFEVKSDFLQTNANYYGAGVFKEPFDDSTVKKINSWVKENTNNMIDGIVDKIDPSTVMYLINALAFEAQWVDPYMDYDVKDSTFTAISGEKQTAKMMGSLEYNYLESEDATGFMKYYSGNKYAFVAILPNGDIQDYISSLSGEKIKNIIDSKSGISVQCELPKFSYEYTKNLNETLINMGITDAFNGALADFSKISDTPLYISNVLHKTYIELDQKGTKAGAVTSVEVNCGSAMFDKPKEVILDRPFLYLIIDTTSNLPVFMGTLTNIK